LANEARKYKSAEEFVRSRDIAYHVTPAEKSSLIDEQGLVAPKGTQFRYGKEETIPNEVYVWKDKKDAELFKKLSEQDGGSYVIKEVDTTGLKIRKDPETFEEFIPNSGIGSGYIVDGGVTKDRIIKTKSQLTDIYNQARGGATGNAGGGAVTYQQLKETRSAVGKKLSDFNDPIATGDKATLEKLYASLSDDMDNALQLTDPATFERVQKANAYYRDTLNKINSDIGKKIANKDPEKLMDELIRPNSETAVKQVKEVIGPEATTKLQQQFMARLVNDSIDKNGFISNTLLEKNIAKYTEPTIKELLDSQQYEKIQFLRSQTGELSGVEDAIKSGVKPAEGSQTAFLGKFGTMGAAMFVRPDVAIGILLSDFGLNKLFQSGFGKELMTRGVDVKVPSVSVAAPSSTAVGVGGAIESGATQKPEEDTGPFAGKTRKEIFDLAIKQGASSKQLEDLSKSYDISQQKPADEYVETKSQEDGMYSPGQLAKAMYKARAANDTASYNALKDMYDLSVAEEKRTNKVAEPKKLTDKQRSYAGAGMLGSEILSILENSPDSISTGPISGRLSKVAEITGTEDEKQTQLKSKIASARTAARNALLGANMSDKELESYLDATFDITLPAPILLTRVKTFISDMKTLAQTDTTGVATDTDVAQ
jgi:hypothetical protein